MSYFSSQGQISPNILGQTWNNIRYASTSNLGSHLKVNCDFCLCCKGSVITEAMVYKYHSFYPLSTVSKCRPQRHSSIKEPLSNCTKVFPYRFLVNIHVMKNLMRLILVLRFDKYTVLEWIIKYGFKFRMWVWKVDSKVACYEKQRKAECIVLLSLTLFFCKPETLRHFQMWLCCLLIWSSRYSWITVTLGCKWLNVVPPW